MKKLTPILIAMLFLTVAAFGDGWEVETVDSDGSVGQYNSLVLDSNDNPKIFYFDSTLTVYAPKYASYDGDIWDITYVDDYMGGGYHSSLKLDSSDNPHISYLYIPKGDPMTSVNYANFDGTMWDITRVDIGEYIGWYTSLALDASGNPHISYMDYDPMELDKRDLKYAYYDGNTWHTTTLDTGGDKGWYTSIALDTSGNVHIAYQEGSPVYNLKYAYYDGTSWELTTIDTGGADAETGYDASLVLDSLGNPHIAYMQLDYNYGALRYATYDGNNWQKETVNSGWVGYHCSMALDASDNPHFAHRNDNTKELLYSKRNGGSWQTKVIDNNGDVGKYTSIAVDTSGNPHISYYNNISEIEGSLKYAHYVSTGVDDSPPVTPTGFALHAAVPNPSNGSASIAYALPYVCDVELSLYDIKGRKIETLADGTYQPGDFSADVKGLNSGIYIYKLKAGEFSDSKKMVVK